MDARSLRSESRRRGLWCVQISPIVAALSFELQHLALTMFEVPRISFPTGCQTSRFPPEPVHERENKCDSDDTTYCPTDTDADVGATSAR